eukprot:scaffold5549_cov79-Skeletonema_dohrnii-CCMP3373.AAC.5
MRQLFRDDAMWVPRHFERVSSVKDRSEPEPEMSLLVHYEHEKPEIAPGQVLSSVPYFLGDLIYAHKIMEPFKAKATNRHASSYVSDHYSQSPHTTHPI